MEETSLLSLKEVSKNSPYGADYLSLLIRSQKLFGKKVDGKWMTTPEAVADYAQKIAQANFAHQESLKVKIPAAEQKKALSSRLGVGMPKAMPTRMPNSSSRKILKII